ncbi:hypothetical protein PS896_01075 [Pseudomonas fluorescens]|uniref:Min27-like integrase DNA-binding domain-containing protein n=1 Tax=Pseudomonas fluorescens TaxID=294 RepID=A0A5E7HS49_PSEFL|nr:hypothetical protein PS896_01075 [Pseudomonas fluorescens]
MGQVSNMPAVLIEGDRNEPDKAHAKGFDWDELKVYYGGGTLGTKGMKTNGNETYEPPFRGAIAISQNADVSASEAILTRIIKSHFARPEVTTESRAAADNLNLIPVEQLSHFLLLAVRAETQVMTRFYFRFNCELCRERFPGGNTAANREHAARLVNIIEYEIQAGTFDYSRHFPDSGKLVENTFGHYLDL